jgi:hypothetical protein
LAFNDRQGKVDRWSLRCVLREGEVHGGMTGSVSARNLRIVGKAVPQAVQIGSVDLAITPKEIRSNNTSLIDSTLSLNYISSSASIQIWPSIKYFLFGTFSVGPSVQSATRIRMLQR